jgi:hypothetical protein
MPKNRISGELQVWIDARKQFHLSHAQIQMARELGLNPKKFGKLANYKQEPWKLPLPQFIEHLYHKRFGKEQPDVVVSIEERAQHIAAKKAARREAKRGRNKQTIGIAWYSPAQWNRLREISADADDLEETHAEWLATAESVWAQMVENGLEVKKVVVDVDQLEAWCREQGLSIDAAARSQFVTCLLRNSQGDRAEKRNGKIEGCLASSAQEPALENERGLSQLDIDPYSPCPCGSGKKYKWCCRKLHRRERR